MLLHLARISVITIAIALVFGVAFVLARPAAPTVITVVVPTQPAVAAAPTTIVQPAYPVYPAWHRCAMRVCHWH